MNLSGPGPQKVGGVPRWLFYASEYCTEYPLFSSAKIQFQKMHPSQLQISVVKSAPLDNYIHNENKML